MGQCRLQISQAGHIAHGVGPLFGLEQWSTTYQPVVIELEFFSVTGFLVRLLYRQVRGSLSAQEALT